MADMAYDHRWKVLLLGDSRTGKSNLASQFTQSKFNTELEPTMGIKPFIKMVQTNGKTIKANIWDTAGQERFRAPVFYYNEAVGALIVYDVTNRQSFENAARWLEEVRDHGDADIAITVVGTKTDLEGQRAVTPEEGKKFADDNQLLFIETSARDNSQVEAVFQTILDAIYKKQCPGQ
ncbi:rab family, other [Fusarium austroafricanum]|uniref:Rab family, other n=1 Tax=Fusarium austroafricanum TaxID=2364996 RepID=A0A8H4KVH9_9HYPO|nr:rab family, other [Fusarium austroafricanum]